MARSQNFTISINQFTGESEYVEHFFNLVGQSAQINKWSPDQTILFIKSKLAGAALKFYLENSELQCTTDVELFETKFKTFFKNDSTQATFNEFNKLAILPDESIKHFCHRLHVLTTTVYKDINDDKALDAIKLNKLLSVLPANLRIKLLEEKVKNFNTAMSRAQEIQNIYNSEFQSNSDSSNKNPQSVLHFSTELRKLNEKVDALTQTKNSTNHTESQANQNLSNQNGRNQRAMYRQPYRNRFNNRFPVKCQLCFRVGHTANRCFKYVNSQRFSNHARQNSRNAYLSRRNNNNNNSADNGQNLN